MTLLALILSIGLIIDDAIVVLENTSRHMQRGLTAAGAAKSGTYEIAFAIIAMTITLAVVYAPISLVSGFSGDLLKPFVFTLARPGYFIRLTVPHHNPSHVQIITPTTTRPTEKTSV